ncbi:hypothetical protein J6590_001676, partial [Homalodisca vitripennis]
TNGLNVTCEPPIMAGQAVCKEQDRSEITHSCTSHAQCCQLGYLAMPAVPAILCHIAAQVNQ